MPADNSIEDVKFGGYSFPSRAEEAGAAKLWSIYAEEAERYDKSLVAGWKSDMEGMLIFAGLFSASLTAFLVESYRNLVPDPGDTTVQLLQQILAVSSPNSTVTPIIHEPFVPPISSLICNALWFISLGLSLSCALVATLLEQWARDFLHRANTQSSPVVRARIYSCLYYGLRRFKMHAVVEIIPSLLHAALLFFFCGLIVFLLPVNKIIAVIVAGILSLVITFYLFLTILPLIHFDSPYRTPRSNALWGVYRYCFQWWRQPSKSNHIHDAPTTIVDKMIEQAITPSDHRHKRDVSALLWTVESLSDNEELQKFVEAIPDAMWGLYGQHRRNVAVMTALRDSEKVNLSFRISELWRSCSDGLLSKEASERRGTASLKAFWALFTIPTPPSPLSTTPHMLPPILQHIPWMAQFPPSPVYVSMRAMAGWSGLTWLRMYLDQCFESKATAPFPDRILAPVRGYITLFSLFSVEITRHAQTLEISTNSRQQFSTASRELCDSISHYIFFDYLKTTAASETLPFRWKESLDIIYPEDFTLDSAMTHNNLQELESVMDTVSLGLASSNVALLPVAMRELFDLWRPQDARRIPVGIIKYLKHYGSNSDTLLPLDAMNNVEVRILFNLTNLYGYLWCCFPATITSSESSTEELSSLEVSLLDDVLAVLWITTSILIEGPDIDRPEAPSREEFNSVIQVLTTCTSPMASAVLLSVKIALLRSEMDKTILLRLDARRLSGIPENAGSAQDGVGKLEAAVIVIADFLEQCTIASAVDVLRAVGALGNILDIGARYFDSTVNTRRK